MSVLLVQSDELIKILALMQLWSRYILRAFLINLQQKGLDSFMVDATLTTTLAPGSTCFRIQTLTTFGCDARDR